MAAITQRIQRVFHSIPSFFIFTGTSVLPYRTYSVHAKNSVSLFFFGWTLVSLMIIVASSHCIIMNIMNVSTAIVRFELLFEVSIVFFTFLGDYLVGITFNLRCDE